MMYPTFDLTVKQLVCVQHERPLFKPLSFSINNQQILLLHGPNGVGKTTCLRTLTGLLQPMRGHIYWNQQSIVNFSQDYLASMLYLGHQPGIKLTLTPTENLQLYLSLQQQSVQMTRILEVLAQVNLRTQAAVPCGELSAGQQRRVALARLSLMNRPLWILDEPLTALDTPGVAFLQCLLTQHAQAGGAVIFTSHQPVAVATRDIALESWITC